MVRKVLSWVLLLFFFSGFNMVQAQTLRGKIVDEKGNAFPGVKISSKSAVKPSLSQLDGQFSLLTQVPDTITVSYSGYDTLRLPISTLDFQLIQLNPFVKEYSSVNAYADRLANFDVGYLPLIKGTQIYTGTNAVIELNKLSGAKSTGNPREIFAKIPGLNIWETDGAGIQMGIGGRGLSPNRTANFNTRQNGYDISADALGYPESYYTPPIEALKSIEIIRGSAALQFGTQFGGLLNFIIKEPPSQTKFELTSRQTGGSYGYFGTFNRVAGSKNRFYYQAYHQYKRGDGYRQNSGFYQHQGFAQVGYYFNAKSKLSLEYTHMSYLARQAGGLSDAQFNLDPQASFRNRNWFQVKWNMLAAHYDYEFSPKTLLNIRAFGMLSSRETLGFLGKITQKDPETAREMLYGDFKNAGVEARLLTKYKMNFLSKNKERNGAFLLGSRYYQGISTALQGLATDGDQATFNYRNPNDLEGSDFTYPSQNLALFTDNILYLTPSWNVNAGARLEYIKSSSFGYFKQNVVHPVNGDTLSTMKLTDSNNVERTVLLLGFGSSYKFKNNSVLYANFTQNYRAINFTDIRVNNPNVVVDPNIRDEYGYTTELGYRGLLKDYFIYDFAAFYVFYGDKIGLAPKPGTIQKERTNIGDAVNVGLESFMEFDFLKAFNDSSKYKLSLFSNVAYIHSRYVRSKEKAYLNKQVEYVSPLIIRSGIKFANAKWNIQIQGSYNSDQFADATNAIVPSGDAVIGLVPAYMVFDFSSRYTFSQKFQMELGVNNFTNEKYFTRRATGYPGPGILPSDGISFYLSLQLQLSSKK